MACLLIVVFIILMIGFVISWVLLEVRNNTIDDELDNEFNEKNKQNSMYDDSVVFVIKLRDECDTKK